MTQQITQLAGGQDCLTGQLLVAMPSLTQGCFEKSVILICGHDDNHAMGLIVNKQVTDITFSEILDQLDFDKEAQDQPPHVGARHEEKVHYGGPVETKRGLVLHTLDKAYAQTIQISATVGLTATKEVLSDMSGDKTPLHAKLCMGHAGWGPGQLEDELVQNAWLTLPATHELIFETDMEACWLSAMAQIGIDPAQLGADFSTPRDPDAPLN